MNISHRSIWNSALGAWVAVSEITRARGKRSGAVVALVLIGSSVCSSVGAQEVIDGTVTVTGPPASPWATHDDLYVGYIGTGTLTVQDGGTVSSFSGRLGVDSNAIGHATVTGAGATWTNSSGLYVGDSGNGTLTVSNGGKVSNRTGHIGNFSGSTGHATVTGAGSTWTNSSSLDVGNQGQGTLTVSAGGKVSNTFGYIGRDPGATGAVTVTGAGSTWTNSIDLRVGYNGQGTLTVSDGGKVSNVYGYIGNFPGSIGTATVTGAGSTWTNSIGLRVGYGGQGTLTVSDGGKVSNTLGVIGFNASAIGTATVTGAGSTWTNSGTLEVGHSGAGTLTVQAGGAVSNTFGTVGFNTGAIGAATVTGAGSTWTNNGGLVVGNQGKGTLTVSAGGAVSNTSGAIGNLASSIGAATVTGAGSTWTNSGNLTVGNSGQGTLTIADSGKVAVNSGPGMLSVAANAGSTGVVNIGGAVGSTAVAAGTVEAGELRFGAGTGSLNFNHTGAAYTFGTPITGVGVVNQVAGTTILLGANTYTGATTVNGGTLRVNGSIASSAVTVNNGGVLGGSGTVGRTTIAAGGVVAPGNSIGTLTVAGNLNFAPGSIYRVEVDAAGNNDRINVTGTAALDGTVDVQASAGTYAANTTYTILNAAGGRTGNFAGVTSNLAFLTPTLGYDANAVSLTLARNDISFSGVAQTLNQIATATALQNAVTGASGDMEAVVNVLIGLSAEQARAAYDSTSGAGLVALRGAGAGFAAGFGNQLQARLGAVSSGSGLAFANRPLLLAANDHVSDLMAPVSDSAPQKFSLAGGASSSSSSSSQGRGFWLRGSGGYQNTNSDGNAAASNLRSGGISAGFDAEVREGLVLGAALSSGTSRLSFDNNNDSGKSRGSAVALYGSYAAGPWAFNGSASLAWNSNHMDRSVVVGAISRVASSDFDSHTLSAYGEATYSMPMNGWTLQPLAALSLSRNKSNGFTETGAGALNLQIAGQTTTSTKSLLGAKASFDIGSVHLEPRIIWAHEFGDLNTPMTAQFHGATALPFQVSGVALKRDTLILGLGAAGSIGKGIDLFADVQAEHNSAQRNLAVLVGLRSRW